MLFNVIKYLIYLFIEINNKFKYIYNCVHVRMGYVIWSKSNNWVNSAGTFGRDLRKKHWSCLVLSILRGVVISYIMNLAHGGTVIIYIADMP